MEKNTLSGPAWSLRATRGATTRTAPLAPETTLFVDAQAQIEDAPRPRTVEIQLAEPHAYVVDRGVPGGVWCAGLRVVRAYVPLTDTLVLGAAQGDSVLSFAQAVEDRVGLPLAGLVGGSPAMRHLASLVRRMAPHRFSILVRGGSGTGKELIAREIHRLSRRPGRLVAINASTLTPDLAASALFGHVKGSFTGADRDRRGAFAEADRGTLFIDEIACLHPTVQAQLLRALEEASVTPVGGAPIATDVRIIAATCEPLEALVEAGAFRRDLFERLAVCRLRVPPLCERREDLPALAAHLLEAHGFVHKHVTRGGLERLRRHPLPGNVRQLRNALVQAAIVTEGGGIGATALDEALAPAAEARERLSSDQARRFLDETGGNISQAARRARLPRSTFRDLLRAGQPAAQAA